MSGTTRGPSLWAEQCKARTPLPQHTCVCVRVLLMAHRHAAAVVTIDLRKRTGQTPTTLQRTNINIPMAVPCTTSRVVSVKVRVAHCDNKEETKVGHSCPEYNAGKTLQ